MLTLHTSHLLNVSCFQDLLSGLFRSCLKSPEEPHKCQNSQNYWFPFVDEEGGLEGPGTEALWDAAFCCMFLYLMDFLSPHPRQCISGSCNVGHALSSQCMILSCLLLPKVDANVGWSHSGTPSHCGHPSVQATALTTYLLHFTITHNFLVHFASSSKSKECFECIVSPKQMESTWRAHQTDIFARHKISNTPFCIDYVFTSTFCLLAQLLKNNLFW